MLMRSGLALGGVCALLVSAAAQEDEPRTVTTRVRHVSTVVLPVSDTIVEVVAGDGEYWDVSASAHLAFIRPLIAGGVEPRHPDGGGRGDSAGGGRAE